MNIERIRNLIRAFYPYAKEKLNFDAPVKVKYIIDDLENYNDPLGKTAFYAPDEKMITLFTLNRHPKDILRSFAHELTHHAQHCRGEFDNSPSELHDGYAQEDPHMREMEEEAYLNGGMLVRDWTDELKQKEKKALIMIMENDEKEHKEVRKVKKILEDEQSIQDMLEAKRLRLNKKLLDKYTKNDKRKDNIE